MLAKTSESRVTSQKTVHLTETKDESDRVAALGAELKVPVQITELEKDTGSWSQSCVAAQLQILNVPSAPALYPSLPTLEEGPVMQLSEEAVKNRQKGPAVLALPEQESSPPSLQPVDSVAELCRSKLYPPLPKTAPEMQVILLAE